MASKLDLTVVERNDPVITVTATKNDAALDLTGLDLECVIKAKAADDDATGTTLTSTAGDIVVTDAVAGICELHIPAAAIAVPPKRAYHFDALDGGLRHTLLYGSMNVIDI